MNERIKAIEIEMNKLKSAKSQGLISPEDYENFLLELFDRLDKIDIEVTSSGGFIDNISDLIKKNSNITVAKLYPIGFSLN